MLDELKHRELVDQNSIVSYIARYGSYYVIKHFRVLWVSKVPEGDEANLVWR